MEFQMRGQVKDFGDLENGAVFVATVGRDNYICLKSYQRRNVGNVDWVVSLVPGRPDCGGNPGIFDVGDFVGQPVLELSDVEFEIPINHDNVEFDVGYNPTPGCVFLFGDAPYLSVVDRAGGPLINISTGELTERPPENNHAKIRHWRLNQSVNNDIRELGSHPPSEAEQRNEEAPG